MAFLLAAVSFFSRNCDDILDCQDRTELLCVHIRLSSLPAASRQVAQKVGTAYKLRIYSHDPRVSA